MVDPIVDAVSKLLVRREFTLTFVEHAQVSADAETVLDNQVVIMEALVRILRRLESV